MIKRVVIIPDDTILERYNTLFESVCSCMHQYNNNSSLSFERNLQSILKLFASRSAAMIMFTLNEIKFSSQSELHNQKKLGLGSKIVISNVINQLELFGIVTQIAENDPKLELIKAFWKTEHPTSPYEPRFYEISQDFKKVIGLYTNDFERYIWKKTQSEIHRRKTNYENFYQENKQEFEDKRKLEDGKIGNCENCNKIIPKDTKRESYDAYDSGVFVCNTCKKGNKIPKELMSKWMRKSK